MYEINATIASVEQVLPRLLREANEKGFPNTVSNELHPLAPPPSFPYLNQNQLDSLWSQPPFPKSSNPPLS